MRRFSLPWPGTIALVVVISFVLVWPLLRHQLDRWRLLPQPEGYTELYFVDHQHLPSHYQAGQTWALKFVIKNQEAQQVDYQYQVMIVDDQQPLVLATRHVNLTANDTSQQSFNIKLTESYKPLEIKVSLAYQIPRPYQNKPQLKQQQIIYHIQPTSADPSL